MVHDVVLILFGTIGGILAGYLLWGYRMRKEVADLKVRHLSLAQDMQDEFDKVLVKFTALIPTGAQAIPTVSLPHHIVTAPVLVLPPSPTMPPGTDIVTPAVPKSPA